MWLNVKIFSEFILGWLKISYVFYLAISIPSLSNDYTYHTLSLAWGFDTTKNFYLWLSFFFVSCPNWSLCNDIRISHFNIGGNHTFLYFLNLKNTFMNFNTKWTSLLKIKLSIYMVMILWSSLQLFFILSIHYRNKIWFFHSFL